MQLSGNPGPGLGSALFSFEPLKTRRGVARVGVVRRHDRERSPSPGQFRANLNDIGHV